MTESPQLKLLKSFSDDAYPYLISEKLGDPLDGQNRIGVKNALLRAARRSGIRDYTLTDDFGAIALHLRKERDFDKACYALDAHDGPIEKEYCLADMVSNWRRLKKLCKHVQNTIEEKTPLAGKVRIKADKEAQTVTVAVADLSTYFAFKELTSDLPIFKLG